MRKAIRNRLLDKITSVGERVYEPHMAGPQVDKPYIVIKFGGSVPTNMRYGFNLPIEVWLYVDRTSFGGLDAMERLVVNSLVNVDLKTTDSQVFSLLYTGSSPDYYDDDWKALTRRLSFVTNGIRGD